MKSAPPSTIKHKRQRNENITCNLNIIYFFLIKTLHYTLVSCVFFLNKYHRAPNITTDLDEQRQEIVCKHLVNIQLSERVFTLTTFVTLCFFFQMCTHDS